VGAAADIWIKTIGETFLPCFFAGNWMASWQQNENAPHGEAIQSSAPCPHGHSPFVNESGRIEGEWEQWWKLG